MYEAGVDWIQLRDRSIPDRRLFEVAQAIAAARNDALRQQGPETTPPRLILNKRIDVALAARADGVHLGFDAVAASEIERTWPSRLLLGASLHSIDEVASIGSGRLAYAHLAPIWDPLSKPATRPALGLDPLRAAVRLGLPILAQGGLDPERAADATRAGAAGIAVTGSLASAQRPEEAIEALRHALDGT